MPRCYVCTQDVEIPAPMAAPWGRPVCTGCDRLATAERGAQCVARVRGGDVCGGPAVEVGGRIIAPVCAAHLGAVPEARPMAPRAGRPTHGAAPNALSPAGSRALPRRLSVVAPTPVTAVPAPPFRPVAAPRPIRPSQAA